MHMGASCQRSRHVRARERRCGWLVHGSFLGGSADAVASLAAVISEVRMSQYLSTGKSSEFFFSSRSTLASNFGAPSQPSPATSALAATFASNFGAPGQPRQQLRRSWSTFASNFGAPGQPSPATSALPVNLRQQLRRSQSTFAGNFGAPPGQPSPVNPRPSQAALRVRGWALRVFSSLAAPRHLLGSHEQPSTYPIAPSDVLYPVIGQFSTRSACILPFFCDTSNSG